MWFSGEFSAIRSSLITAVNMRSPSTVWLGVLMLAEWWCCWPDKRRARAVTAGDISHGSLLDDGLIWYNTSLVALIVCLLLFVSLATCAEWCFLVCPGAFVFSCLCQYSFLNHLSSCCFSTSVLLSFCAFYHALLLCMLGWMMRV